MLPVRGGTPGPEDGVTQAVAPQRTAEAAANAAAERDEIIKSPNVFYESIGSNKDHTAVADDETLLSQHGQLR